MPFIEKKEPRVVKQQDKISSPFPIDPNLSQQLQNAYDGYSSIAQFKNKILNPSFKVWTFNRTNSNIWKFANCTWKSWPHPEVQVSQAVENGKVYCHVEAISAIDFSTLTDSGLSIQQEHIAYDALYVLYPMVLSFDVRSNVTGEYTAHIHVCKVPGDLNSRIRISRKFTIDNPNTWERKVLFFPPYKGTTNFNSIEGLVQITFTIEATPDRRTVTIEDDWDYDQTENRNVVTTPTAVSWGNIGDYFDITNVQLENGIDATSFSERPYALDWIWSQYLCQVSYPYGYNLGNADLNTAIETLDVVTDYVIQNCAKFAVRMRSSPVISIFSAKTGAEGYVYSVLDDADIAVTNVSVSENGIYEITLASNTVATDVYGRGHFKYHFYAHAQVW